MKIAAPKAPPRKRTTAPKAKENDTANAATGAQASDPSKKAATAGQGSHPRNKSTVAGDDMDALLRPFYYSKGLTDPINTAQDKWNLLPAFLRVKGLIKQHTDSFDYFCNVELKKILKANEMIISKEMKGKKWIRFTDIRVGEPSRVEDAHKGYVQTQVTPNECRLRDMTYSAPIYIDYVYPRQSGNVKKTNVQIGRMPMMLRSSRCVLSGRPESDMGTLNECAVDPGGYFIVRGQEKVILVQEQLSKNRIIVESFKGMIQASVTSHTANVKTLDT